MRRKGLLTSSLNFAICKKFREHNIEIPYPLDIRLRNAESGIGPRGSYPQKGA
jgi:small-conductance mechanosensitive channel